MDVFTANLFESISLLLLHKEKCKKQEKQIIQKQ